jgi:superfamily II DNA or RNA helicase
VSDIAAGEIVVVRDEEWLVRSVRTTAQDETRLEVTGVSELVRDQNAVFYDSLEHEIQRVDPRAAEPVFDETPGFRRSRLWLESVLRRSPVPVSDPRIAVGHRGLLDRMDYQLRPAEQALRNLRPRILIGDAVGLGKTLEIGILLAELIRRGRGERILVVTPRAVLEQFQQELWTRFAVPLIRLDSAGIQKVRRTLPASRNPFSYYQRVIVSVDTLKNPVHYRHHLRQHRWDVVVIDECHNLVNRGTQNNALARLLAEQTDALILASATPHNGKPESFAELVNLLDPTAIADAKRYTADDIAHLYVRRHRNSADVGAEVAHNWKQRAEPHIRPVDPTVAEHAVLRELNDTWLHPGSGHPVVGKGRQLFPWTLFKAFLSSPQALRASIGRRLAAGTSSGAVERAALLRLDDLAKAAENAPAKLTALREHLHQIGVGRASDTRVVVFSERIDTLTWLRGELLQGLRLPAAAVEVLHASLPDETIQAVVEGFGQASSVMRVLLASDMASEGLNLHQACHHLVHYDLPWSFIRIQQRNGRIDRYGQLIEPQITALALTSEDPQIATDLRVVTKLLQKEHAANLALGDAGVLLDLNDASIEEEAVMAAMSEGHDLDHLARAPDPAALNPFAALMAVGGEHRSDPAPEIAPPRTLFDDDDFLAAALAEVETDVGARQLDIVRETENDLIAFDPPDDLLPRFRDLPADYLAERRVTERLRLSASVAFADQRLAKARRETDSTWPDVHFLGPLHPVLDWAADRALSRFGRMEVPVLVGDVGEPTFLTQAVWSNRLGQPAIGHFGAVTGLSGTPVVGDLLDAVRAAGIKERAINPGGVGVDLAPLKALLPLAIDAATKHLYERREAIEDDLLHRIESYRSQLRSWEQLALLRLEEQPGSTSRKRARVVEIADETSQLIDSLAASGDPYVRIVGIIVPRRTGARETASRKTGR